MSTFKRGPIRIDAAGLIRCFGNRGTFVRAWRELVGVQFIARSTSNLLDIDPAIVLRMDLAVDDKCFLMNNRTDCTDVEGVRTRETRSKAVHGATADLQIGFDAMVLPVSERRQLKLVGNQPDDRGNVYPSASGGFSLPALRSACSVVALSRTEQFIGSRSPRQGNPADILNGLEVAS